MHARPVHWRHVCLHAGYGQCKVCSGALCRITEGFVPSPQLEAVHELGTICAAEHTLCNDDLRQQLLHSRQVTTSRGVQTTCVGVNEGQCTPATPAASAAAAAAAAALAWRLKMAVAATCC
jgi:hypothetical protein